MTELSFGRQSGFSLVEILVTLVIVMIGLLGLAGVQIRAHQAELESYQRAQALVLVADMVERINANRKVADCYASNTNVGVPAILGTDNATVPACAGFGTAELQKVAVDDLTAWDGLLKGSSESLAADGTAPVGAMVGARGCIVFVAATQTYRVSVAWQGIAPTAAPTEADLLATCGLNLYGTDNMRREVSASVRIANLK